MGWMHWNIPSIIGFISVGVVVLTGALLDKYYPHHRRKGFLPMETTRGDRIFLSSISFFGTCLLWLGLLPDVPIYGACVISAGIAFIIMKSG